MIFPQETLNCGGRLLDLNTPKIMGVINVTPDSFYSGSRQQQLDDVLRTAEKMLEEGATILDLGGMSSRPGAAVISVELELKRVIAPVEAIIKRFPNAIVSIDTVQSVVAKEAVAAGASMINDISAGAIDPKMYETISTLNVPYILMHMRGTPETMQQQINYQDIVKEILDFFIEQVAILRSKGLKDIIIDPGFGFGKSIRQNYELLNGLPLLQILEVPLLIGASRKSMIYKFLDITPSDALNGTTVVHVLALQNGARILRVHDVKEASEAVKIWQLMEEIKTAQA